MNKRLIEILVILLVNSGIGLTQHPVWPKFVNNKDITSRYIDKVIKLHLIGNPCDSLLPDSYRCIEDSILLPIKQKDHYFKLLVYQSVEGLDYDSMHLSCKDSSNKKLIKIFDSRLDQITSDSIKVDMKIRIYDLSTGELKKSDCFNKVTWISMKELRGIYRPDRGFK